MFLSSMFLQNQHLCSSQLFLSHLVGVCTLCSDPFKIPNNVFHHWCTANEMSSLEDAAMLFKKAYHLSAIICFGPLIWRLLVFGVHLILP